MSPDPAGGAAQGLSLRLSGSRLIVAIAMAVALAFAFTAIAPTGAEAGNKQIKKLKKQVKKAKKIAKKANKTASQALDTAAQALENGGPQGPQGEQGPQGPPGNDGADGADGAPGADGSDGSDGAPGADGKTVLNGFGAPNDATDGDNGDFYINTDTQEMWGPKSGGSWAGTGPVALQGSPWAPENELPSGATLTGTWSYDGDPFGAGGPGVMPDGEAYVESVSFGIPVVPQPTATVLGVSASAPGCPGVDDNGTPADTSDDVPQADSGNFCVYNRGGGGLATPDVTPWANDGSASGSDGTDPSGSLLYVSCDAPPDPFCEAKGLWAVTG